MSYSVFDSTTISGRFVVRWGGVPAGDMTSTPGDRFERAVAERIAFTLNRHSVESFNGLRCSGELERAVIADERIRQAATTAARATQVREARGIDSATIRQEYHCELPAPVTLLTPPPPFVRSDRLRGHDIEHQQVTADFLRRVMGACTEVDTFARHFPDGLPFSVAGLRTLRDCADIHPANLSWFADGILSGNSCRWYRNALQQIPGSVWGLNSERDREKAIFAYVLGLAIWGHPRAVAVDELRPHFLAVGDNGTLRGHPSSVPMFVGMDPSAGPGHAVTVRPPSPNTVRIGSLEGRSHFQSEQIEGLQRVVAELGRRQTEMALAPFEYVPVPRPVGETCNVGNGPSYAELESRCARLQTALTRIVKTPPLSARDNNGVAESWQDFIMKHANPVRELLNERP